MADFRTKFFVLAGLATLVTGLAQAQVVCTANPAAAGFVAAEGTTEQVADTTLSCTNSGANGATLTLQVYLSPAVTITSATLNNGSKAFTEALAGVTADFTAAVNGGGGTPNANVVSGVVSGSSVIFSNIAIPVNTAANITITNIKINASQVASSGGAPTGVTETIFTSGTNVVPGPASASPINVAYVTNGLTNVSTSNLANNGGAGSIAICTGSDAWAASSKANGFNVYFNEGFPTAFKTAGSATANGALGSEFAANTYTGFGVTTGASPASNTANSGTIIQVTYSNVPGGITLYTPLTITNNGGTMTLVNGATGSIANVTGATNVGAPGDPDGKSGGDGSYAAVTISNGSGSVYYEETTNFAGGVEAYTLPTRIQAGSGAVTAPSTTNIMASVSFAPVGATTTPNFVVGSSTPAKAPSGNSFGACTTTLLFPFVTNQLGFDTGIAISNTSMDALKSGGKSQASVQTGTCSLTFFGNTPPAAVTTSAVAAGTTYAAAASTIAPGFQGYMFAQCNFLYAHGFAYVVYNLTQNNGAAMGYLADVLSSDRTSPIPTLSSKSTLTGGVLTSVTVTSGNSAVGNTAPESWGH